MKAVKLSVVLLIIIIIGTISYVYIINNTSELLLKKIYFLEEQVSSSEWNSAYTQLNTLSEAWLNNEKWLTILIDHQHIEEIKICLAKMYQYLNHRESADFLAESASLKLLVMDISKREKLNINNLF